MKKYRFSKERSLKITKRTEISILKVEFVSRVPGFYQAAVCNNFPQKGSGGFITVQISHVAHNSWVNIGKLRSDCWPTVGNARFANRVPPNHLPTMASGWASQQWANKIIFYWSNNVLK